MDCDAGLGRTRGMSSGATTVVVRSGGAWYARATGVTKAAIASANTIHRTGLRQGLDFTTAPFVFEAAPLRLRVLRGSVAGLNKASQRARTASMGSFSEGPSSASLGRT